LIDGKGVLISGPSGTGKSDLALRLLMQPFHDAGRAVTISLLADDQVAIERRADGLHATCPKPIEGRLEVRGLGIMRFECARTARLELVVRICPTLEIERLPDPMKRFEVLGIQLPVVEIDAREAGAAAKVVLARLRLGAD
jgi:serine kinase of HPr protein (carbohydrate metabolism regulator)